MDLRIDNDTLRAAVTRACRLIDQAGGRALLVGGCVRDALLDRPVKDVDMEVYGLSPGRLRAALGAELRIDLVGAAFGVLKVRGIPLDIAIPRRESKSGLGHKAFDIASDPSMTFEEASARRDFTINAMACDLRTGELLDAHGGRQDLEARVLRHTSARFSEDPLRVLRGMQFAARFDLTPAPETVALCRSMPPEGLARERVFDEWRKLILLGRKPSTGLSFLRATGWLRFYPELAALVDCPQEPAWHPEGDVWTHTLLCMDAFAAHRIGDEEEDIIVGLAVLCHDFGKPATTGVEDGRIRSIGHTRAGEEPTRRFLARMTDHKALIEGVIPLVTNHLHPLQLYNGRAGDAAIRRLAVRVGRIDRLLRVEMADQRGRGDPGLAESPHAAWLRRRAHELAVRDAAPAPIMMGRHLIELGLEPGPRFGPLLDACYDAQLEGRINSVEEGLRFLRERLDSNRS